VFDAVFLGAAMQMPSLLQIEAECRSGALAKRIGPLSADTLGWRWCIVAEVFQTITADCNLKHPAVHQSTAQRLAHSKRHSNFALHHPSRTTRAKSAPYQQSDPRFCGVAGTFGLSFGLSVDLNRPLR